jgi:hydrogenase maturation factor
VGAAEADRVVDALRRQSIEAKVIGRVLERSERPIVLAEIDDRVAPLRAFERDEIARLF